MFPLLGDKIRQVIQCHARGMEISYNRNFIFLYGKDKMIIYLKHLTILHTYLVLWSSNMYQTTLVHLSVI